MIKVLGLLTVLSGSIVSVHGALALTLESDNTHSHGGGANFSDPDEQLPDMEAHVSEDPSGTRIVPNDAAQALPLFSSGDHKTTQWGFVYPSQQNR